MQQNVPVHFKKWTKYFPVTLQPLLDTAAETLTCKRRDLRQNWCYILNNAWISSQCVPPMGEPKQLETPTAQAAANISVFLDSFYKLSNTIFLQ